MLSTAFRFREVRSVPRRLRSLDPSNSVLRERTVRRSAPLPVFGSRSGLLPLCLPSQHLIRALPLTRALRRYAIPELQIDASPQAYCTGLSRVRRSACGSGRFFEATCHNLARDTWSVKRNKPLPPSLPFMLRRLHCTDYR